jgi:segregation and condensation protein B
MHGNSSQLAGSPANETSSATNERDSSPLSLSRLRDAFAAMLNPQAAQQEAESTAYGEQSTENGVLPAPDRAAAAWPTATEISPRSVVEALLFVGRPDNRPFSARELAAAMRGVSPAEIDAAVAELNAIYDADRAPYRIVGNSAGYQMVLREEFARMRDKFYGRLREAKLSAAAIEVLSIVAYNQPVTAEDINALRSTPSGAVLATLVRRRLLRLERPADKQAAPQYSTTERFLRLFGLDNLSALPRNEELEKA